MTNAKQIHRERINIAMACKLMPYYRLGIFQRLSAIDSEYRFCFFGDTIKKGGIEPIPYKYAHAKGAKKIRWVKTKNFLYKPDKLLWQTGIIKEIFKSKYKVFVFEGAIGHLPIWLYALLCKIRGKKVVYWTHGNRGLDKGIKKKLRIVFFKWLGDMLFLYGHYQKKNMIADGYDPKTLCVIYNSLQPEKQFKTLEKIEQSGVTKNSLQLFADSTRFTLIFIGRLASGKGVLDILRLIKELKDNAIFVNCIFIGEGSEKSKMTTYIQEHKLDNQIYFAGALYDENKIAPYFLAADLMISPGNVGLNCMHSLAYGVPVLTHDNFKYQNPEVEAITDGKTGFFYKHGDFDDMVQKLKEWISLDIPQQTIKSNCQQIIKEIYNPNYQAKCMVDGINTMLYGK